MATLGDFASYDLGRVLEALEADVAELPDQPSGPALRRAFTKLVSWNHHHRTCWDDPTFLARYLWLREQLRIDEAPALAATIDRLAALVRQLTAHETPDDDTPF